MTRGNQGLKRKNNVMLSGDFSVVSEYEQVVLHGIVIQLGQAIVYGAQHVTACFK